MIDTLLFGNIVFLIIVGITIYHNLFINKKDARWFLIYIPLIILCYCGLNFLWRQM